jgi:hypothetical protein
MIGVYAFILISILASFALPFFYLKYHRQVFGVFKHHKNRALSWMVALLSLLVTLSLPFIPYFLFNLYFGHLFPLVSLSEVIDEVTLKVIFFCSYALSLGTSFYLHAKKGI